MLVKIADLQPGMLIVMDRNVFWLEPSANMQIAAVLEVVQRDENHRLTIFTDNHVRVLWLGGPHEFERVPLLTEPPMYETNQVDLLNWLEAPA